MSSENLKIIILVSKKVKESKQLTNLNWCDVRLDTELEYLILEF